MRLGLSHKELDALIHGLDELVDVYGDDVEMQRDTGNDFIIWRRLLARAIAIRDARNGGTLCLGCGDPRGKPGSAREWSEDLVPSESFERGRGPDDEGMYPGKGPSHGPGAREGDGEPMPLGAAESRADSSSGLKNYIRRAIWGSTD